MKLLIEYFKSNNSDRDKEFKTCISENVKNRFIDKIFVFISDDSVLDIESDKIEIVKVEKRPSYLFLFDFCSQNLKDEICIISNTDIFFDDTLKYLETDLTNQFLCLTRWDIVPYQGGLGMQFYDHPWRGNLTTGMLSQDCWIFKSPIPLDTRCDFLMGKPGCDNRISQILHENGYNVKNPSKQIVTKHLHITNHRTYNHTDLVYGPYLLVTPTDDINKDSQKQTIQSF
jgi:hypothetical protein